ncbi:MAG: polymer-forming cytoskeletal protein [Blastocatellia bacterium]|nr:polymer-forming cytoskeletal protein [Blastocatellia bacterium]
MSDNVKRTIIEEGSELTGTLKSTCDVVVSGKVNGELQAPALNVSQGGAVHGNIKVTNLHSEGEIAGQIEADKIELSGRVNDQTTIRANTLEVKLSAPEKLQVVFGNCTLEVGKDKDAAPAAGGGEPAQKENKPPQGQPQQQQGKKKD